MNIATNGSVEATLTILTSGVTIFETPEWSAEFCKHSDFARFTARNNARLLEVLGDDTMRVRLTPPAYVHYFR